MGLFSGCLAIWELADPRSTLRRQGGSISSGRTTSGAHLTETGPAAWSTWAFDSADLVRIGLMRNPITLLKSEPWGHLCPPP